MQVWVVWINIKKKHHKNNKRPRLKKKKSIWNNCMNLMLGKAEDNKRSHRGYKKRKKVEDKTSQRDGKF